MVKKGKGTKSTKSVAIEEIKEIPNTLKVKRKSAKKIIDEDEIPEENQPAIESGNEDSDVEELSDDADVADEDGEADTNESDDDDEESNENSDENDEDEDSDNEGEDSEHDSEDSEHDDGESDNDDEKMNNEQGKKKSKKRKAEEDDSDLKNGKKNKNSKDIFIGNISFKANEASLKEFFESMDITVESVRITADQDGKSKGFGYLTTTAEDAEKVLEMTDVEFDGRTLRLDNAAPKRTPGSGRGSERGGRGNERGGRGSSRGGRGDGRDHNNTPSNLLLVKNLSYNTDSDSLLHIFKGASDVRLLKDRDTGKSRGRAFVEYDTKEAAVAACKAKSGQEIDGRAVNIVYALPREDFNGADGDGRSRGRDGFRGGRGRGRGGGRGRGRGRGGHR